MNGTAQRLRSLPPYRPSGVAIGFLCLVLVAPGSRAQQAAAPGAGSSTESIDVARPAAIHVDLAELGGGANPCDVTALVREKCEKRTTCEIQVSKNLCHDSHLPGLIQSLKVGYRCRIGEFPRTVTADEPDRLRLLCAPPLAPQD
jgi:hypothetical protein